MKKHFVFWAVISIFFPHEALSQERSGTNARLVATDYAISFAQIFVGKTIRGQNLGRSFVSSLYQAAPATALQYAGMRMVGKNWQLALPAQLLIQKGVAIQRRSIMGEQVFSRELLTSWDLDYLWFNLRIRDGRLLSPRLNVVTAVASVAGANARLEIGRSLETGVLLFSSSSVVTEGYGGTYVFGSIHMLSVNEGSGGNISHELVHRFQDLREGVLTDIFLRQDSERGWPVPFVRLDLSLSYPAYWAQERLSPDCHDCRPYEWEARIHSGQK